MKNLPKFLGIIALAAVIGFTAASCSDGGGGGGGGNPGGPTTGGLTTSGPTSAKYVSYDEENNKYELVITEADTGRTAYKPKDGDTYKLTITFSADGKKVTSTGTVAKVTSVEITLTHSGSGTEIKVTVSSGDDNNTITSFSVDIPVDRGEPVTKPDALADDIPYTLNSDKQGYTVTRGIVKNGVAIIPETFRGLPVVGIGGAAFANNKNLISVTIPANITSIEGWGNFEGCTNLTTVTFAPNSQLKTIGGGAFIGCTSLSAIEIPASVTEIINWGNFSGCTSLKTVTFASGSQLKTIGGGVFEDCTSLVSIEIPASVTSFDDWGSFHGCTNLTTVTFAPNSQLKTIGYGDKGGGTFFNCKSLKNIAIPAGVTHIGPQAFQGSGITSINIPSGITSIGGGAFDMYNDDHIDSKLTTVTFEAGSKLKNIDERAFAYCTSVTSITIPAGVTSIRQEAFAMWTSSQTINIQGHASEASADAAWGAAWRDDQCNAAINYNG